MTRIVLGLSLALLLGFAWLTGIRPAFALAYALLLLFVLAWAWPRLAARGIRLRRTLDAGRPTVGETFEETFEVSKRGVVPAPWVEIADLSRVREYHPGRVISLGKNRVSWVSRGVYRQRGWVTFGPTMIRLTEPFGLFKNEFRLSATNRVLVYPRIRSVPELLMPATHHAGVSQRLGNWADYPPETGGVREYAPGDAYSRIHWPLSIKHEQLMSKTFEQPLTADIWVVLDLHRDVQAGDGEESTLEYAVSLAASLCMQVHERGRRVGLLANDARGTVLEPHRATRQDRVLMDYMAIAEADGPQPLARSLIWERLRRLPKRAVVVITASADPAWVQAMLAVRGRGSSSIAFYLDGPSFGGSGRNLSFDLGSEVDLYVVRQGDDFARLLRTRDAVRLV
ncbi:MAG: DUF58 domain-containing protein [Candidatus Dormibacteraeota bacterium]|nr:DUF58 domain-containing protein [Candidatus Dormibacteraeota bacterium]MDQ6900690.1 DUF58 domain-containing protein [Candidatus Dormibacteraeota bacterium]